MNFKRIASYNEKIEAKKIKIAFCMFFQRQDFKLHARNIYKQFRLKEVNYFFVGKVRKS
jgi:hypothetical protein